MGNMSTSESYFQKGLSVFSKYFTSEYSETTWIYANLGVNQRIFKATIPKQWVAEKKHGDIRQVSQVTQKG